MIPRYQRHACFLHQQFGARLRPHHPDHPGGRADEDQSTIKAGFRELGAFGEKAVAGMNSLGTAPARGVDHPIDIEIAVASARRPEQHGFVGHGDVQGLAVGLGINGDGAQPHRPRRADNPAGNLAAIGDQESAKPAVQSAIHRHILNRPNWVGSIGAFAATESPSPSTSLVSAGSITPSSHSRAVA